MSHIVFHGGGPYMRCFGGKLVQLMDLDKGKRILDVGTGVGSSLIPAAMKTGRGDSLLELTSMEKLLRKGEE